MFIRVCLQFIVSALTSLGPGSRVKWVKKTVTDYKMYNNFFINFIVDGANEGKTIKLQEFLRIDMKDKIIKNILLPPVPISYSIITYKVLFIFIIHSGHLRKICAGNIKRR